MNVEGASGSLQAQVSMSIQTKAQDTSAQLVSKLMSQSLEGAEAMNQARASQGIGTKLNIVA